MRWKVSLDGQVSIDGRKKGTISRGYYDQNERIAEQGTLDNNLFRINATTKIQPISYFITITLAIARIKPITKINFITH